MAYAKNVLRFPYPTGHFNSTLKRRIDEIARKLRAIDEQEMLAGLPECALARASHLEALHLILTVEAELHAVSEDLATNNSSSD